jgi:cytochrome c peroxidase
MNLRNASLLVALAVAGLSVAHSARSVADPAPVDEGLRVEFPKVVPTPADNPTTPEKIELGKKLYFDTRFSINKKISCNSCHDVMASGADGKALSPGHEGKLGGRNSPTVWNSAFSSVQFWDGRAATLEEQAKGPIINPAEMGMPDHDVLMKRLTENKAYVKEFEKVFGPGPITIDKTVKAIAAFERTLITPNSPYDRYVAGDKAALNESAKRGMKLVVTVGCNSCHSGPMFNGPSLPVGQGFYQKFPLIPDAEYEAKYKLKDDPGRFEFTKNEADKNMWRVPTWRNVAITGPYFHNGMVAELDEAVRVMARTQLGKTLQPQEVKDIVAFLNSLTGVKPKIKKPVLPK